jgi:hypothetical protein
MLKVITDPKAWALKYKIPMKKSVCQNCGCEVKLSVPFAVKGYRGLMSEEHACGKQFIVSIAIPTGESLKKLKQLLYG